MRYFSSKFDSIIESCGTAITGGFVAVPSYWSGRGMRSGDLNSDFLKLLHQRIEENYGADAARNFVEMVVSLQDLSCNKLPVGFKWFGSIKFPMEPVKK